MAKKRTKTKEKRPEGPPEAVVQALLTGDFCDDAPGFWEAFDIRYDREKLAAAWEQYGPDLLREWDGPGRPWAEGVLNG